MAHYTAYNFGNEPSSSSLANWAGVPEHASQVSTNFDDGLANISSSNCDDIFTPYLLSSQPDGADGSLALPSPSAPSFPSALVHDAFPTANMVNHAFPPAHGDMIINAHVPSMFPQSDLSLQGHAQFTNAPGPSVMPEWQFPSQGDGQVDHLLASSDYNHYGEQPFYFADRSAIKMPPPAPLPLAMGHIAPANDYGTIGLGYPLMQHMVGVAGAAPSGPTTGVDMNVGFPAFNFTAPRPIRLQPGGSSQVDEKHPIVHVPQRSSDVSDGGSTPDSDVDETSEPKKKRAKQDTMKISFCPYEGCDACKCMLSS